MPDLTHQRPGPFLRYRVGLSDMAQNNRKLETLLILDFLVANIQEVI
jgi:hypothetical protein